MSVLRILASLLDPPVHCRWALLGDPAAPPLFGEGPLAQLPRGAGRVQLLIPAEQVLITQARLPRAARRDAGLVLAFALEDQTATEPELNQVSWLGAAEENEVLAVLDKPGLERWRQALGAVGIDAYEVHAETLLLPRASNEWSLAWAVDGGFVRTSEFEGVATDCSDDGLPSLSVRLLLEKAQLRNAQPQAISVYSTDEQAPPDPQSWTRELGIPVHLAGSWDWRTAPAAAGIALSEQRTRWRLLDGLLIRLRPAACLVGAALLVHALALVIERSSLAHEQRDLRQHMESRFRSVFPDAVAVADPALQMRRKLADARHAAGQPDSSDFLPVIEQVAAAVSGAPSGAVRTVTYDNGRMTIGLAYVDGAAVGRVVERLRQSGLQVDETPASKTSTLLTVSSP